MKINVFKLETGLEEYNDVEYIRITSKDYNLLVMLDHQPVIGEVIGKVEIKLKNSDNEIELNNIKALYMNSHNVFNLMIEGNL